MQEVREIKITLEGVPMSKQSTRAVSKGYKWVSGKNGKPKKVRNTWTFTKESHKKKLRDYQLQIKAQLPKGFQPIEGAISIDRLLFVFPPTKKLLGSKKRLHQFESGKVLPKLTKPDLPDNLKKLPLDALTGIVYKDDSQIWRECKSLKVYGLNPRIEITISYWVSEEVKFLKLIEC